MLTNSKNTELPLDRNCKVLDYHSIGLWAIEKAVGVLSHPNFSGNKTKHTLLKAEYNFEKEFFHWKDKDQTERKLYLCHRLDSPTSGIILAASSLELAEQVRDAFAKRKVHKTYYAIVRNPGKVHTGIWKDQLCERKSNGKLRVTRGNGPTAITEVSVARDKQGLYGMTLLKLSPKTGRTHQLRVQSALRKIPIIGDRTYGDFTLNRKIARASKVDRLCLHAGEIELDLCWKGENIRFRSDCPLPRSFGRILA